MAMEVEIGDTYTAVVKYLESPEQACNVTTVKVITKEELGGKVYVTLEAQLPGSARALDNPVYAGFLVARAENDEPAALEAYEKFIQYYPVSAPVLGLISPPSAAQVGSKRTGSAAESGELSSPHASRPSKRLTSADYRSADNNDDKKEVCSFC